MVCRLGKEPVLLAALPRVREEPCVLGASLGLRPCDRRVDAVQAPEPPRPNYLHGGGDPRELREVAHLDGAPRGRDGVERHLAREGGRRHARPDALPRVGGAEPRAGHLTRRHTGELVDPAASRPGAGGPRHHAEPLEGPKELPLARGGVPGDGDARADVRDPRVGAAPRDRPLLPALGAPLRVVVRPWAAVHAAAEVREAELSGDLLERPVQGAGVGVLHPPPGLEVGVVDDDVGVGDVVLVVVVVDDRDLVVGEAPPRPLGGELPERVQADVVLRGGGDDVVLERPGAPAAPGAVVASEPPRAVHLRRPVLAECGVAQVQEVHGERAAAPLEVAPDPARARVPGYGLEVRHGRIRRTCLPASRPRPSWTVRAPSETAARSHLTPSRASASDVESTSRSRQDFAMPFRA